MAIGYPSNVLVVSDYEKYSFKERIPYRIDFVLSLGDNSMQVLKDVYQKYRKPIFAIRGNHDGKTPFPDGIIDVHLQVDNYRNWSIGGFGGTLFNKDRGHNMWTDADAEYLLDQMPYCDIFICHSPVARATDKPESYAHQGSEAIRKYIREKEPKFVYHGHVHKKLGTMIGNTAVVSVYGYKVVHLHWVASVGDPRNPRRPFSQVEGRVRTPGVLSQHLRLLTK